MSALAAKWLGSLVLALVPATAYETRQSAGDAAAAPANASGASETKRETSIPTVGMPGRVLELVLPGTELEVRARDKRDPLVLRIARVSPHGSAFRYDLEYVGLEPGSYDLRDALRRKDGTELVTDPAAPDSVPSIPVEVASILSAGASVPHHPGAVPTRGFGGYTALLVAGGVVWTFGLALILFGWRKRRRALAELARPLTLAERLKPLVERALAGTLSREERAQLESRLIAFWRRKLRLEETRPQELMQLLRGHEEAGPLFESLEAWLHMPAPPGEVDVVALLAPYRNLPADALPELERAGHAGAAGRAQGEQALRSSAR